MVRVYLSGSNTRADFDDGRKLSFCPKQTRLSVDITGVFSLTDNILKVSERLGKYGDIEGLNGQTFTDVESCLLYLESVVNPPKGAIYEDFNTSDFTAKIGYRHNVAILDQKDLNVSYPLGAVDGDRFFIVPLVNLELDSIIVGGEYIIESKNNEVTTFTFNGANWIPIGGEVSIYQERVKIRMSRAGLMDFSVSGATGVKWVMSTGEVYTQDFQVPSGDINNPRIIFSEAGWVKLYVDDFSTLELRQEESEIGLINSTLSDFAVTMKSLSLRYIKESDLSELKPPLFLFSIFGASINKNTRTEVISTRYFYIYEGGVSDIIADLALFKNVQSNLFISSIKTITCNSSTLATSANNMNFANSNMTQQSIYNLIKYNYDLNNTNKTLGITNNSIPDAATIAMITEMQTNRGWTITHD